MSLRTHLLQTGLDASSVSQITTTLDIWRKSCGPEWTVERIKSLKMWYLRRLNGEANPVIPWVATNKDGTIKGPLRCVFCAKSPMKVLDRLAMYTAFKSIAPTRAQRKKFFSSVRDLPTDPFFIPYLKMALEETIIPEFEEKTYHSYPFSGTRRVPVADCSKTVPNSPEALIDDFRTSIVWDFLDDEECEYVISHTLDNLYIMLVRDVEEDVEDNRVGRIGCIMEKGCKARFVSVPRLVFQLATLSLGFFLFKYLRNLPEDCTYNQEKGALWVHEQLQNGKKVSSIDLSDATNNFPLWLISRVLDWLPIPAPHKTTFIKVATGKWKADHLRGPKELKWNKGQPLGVYPSFAAFAVTHRTLLRALELRHNLKDTFRIIGDDVVISNPLMSFQYRRMLDRMGCPVSESKTVMHSSKLAEFAGRVILERQGIILPKKVLEDKDSNLLERIRRKVRFQREVKTPLDLLSVITSRENPLGLTLWERAAFRSLLKEEEVVHLVQEARDKDRKSVV